jgi:hypothetical protein
MENLLSCKIKQIQTDGGGEYTIHPFKQFLATHGIHHRITCPHTSQQNGIAERKHRHVIETGLALLAQSHLPPKFWVEACLTAVYLINRMPSHTLQNLTLYTNLFKAEPSYSELRVFGCACYPLLHPYNKHKLEFRSKQFIFLGYSSNHKSYRCMDPNTSRIYLSRNVVFDEKIFLLIQRPLLHCPLQRITLFHQVLCYYHPIFSLLTHCPLVTHETLLFFLQMLQESHYILLNLPHPHPRTWKTIPSHHQR